MLNIKNLFVNYNGIRALKGIDLSIKENEIMAVIGESGAGKTTLGLSVAGLVQGHCEGEILFRNRNLLALTGEERRRMRGKELAMLFQNIEEALHPLYRVIDQIIEAITVHGGKDKGAAMEKSLQLLSKVGLLSSHGEAFPHRLSGGEKQRALLAMALANDPALLVLDEPTAALDALTRQEIIGVIRKAASGKAVLLITHDISTAAALSDSTTVLYGGRIMEQGPSKKLLSLPAHPYTRGLLRAYPNMTTTKDLQGIPGRNNPDVPGCPFSDRCTQRIDICSREAPPLQHLDNRLLACHRGGILPLVEIKNLSKSFNATAALQDVHLNIYEGETLAVVGESGSGKTTLAKTIIGLYPDYRGQIRLEGKDLPRSRDKDFYRRVQIIFQNPGESFNHRFNVLKTVKEPLDIQNWGGEADKLERVRRVLEEVELPSANHYLDRYPHHLSGGELQRIAIARALALEPKLIIADEPTSALDASIQAKILRLLHRLQENRGLALLFITHDLALARKVSDRMAVLHRGSVIEKGPTSRITNTPAQEYTRRLLKAAPSLVTGHDEDNSCYC